MHRQQNSPNVPIMELGELVGLGRDKWGRSDYSAIAPVPSFRGSPAWRKDLSDWTGNLDTDTLMLLSFYFLCFSPVITAIVMLLQTHCYPTYLLPNSTHTFLPWLHDACRHRQGAEICSSFSWWELMWPKACFQPRKQTRWLGMVRWFWDTCSSPV